jgi:hypothetical protein
LVDDWDCLKRMVSILIFLIRLWHKACTWSSLLLHIRIQSVCWTYLILMDFARCGFSNPIVVHLLSMAWSTWERLQTFATVVYLRWKWGSRASALAAATTRRGGARCLRDTALDDKRSIAKPPEVCCPLCLCASSYYLETVWTHDHLYISSSTYVRTYVK